MKLLKLAGASLIINIAGSQLALAAEWRFCVAPSDREHTMYMTNPFFTSTSMESLERDFDQLLHRWGRFHDSVQCATGANEQAVRAMREYAEAFNQQMGRMVILIDWKSVSMR
jgi:hypothetical protein